MTNSTRIMIEEPCEHGEMYRHQVEVRGPEEPGEPFPIVQVARFLCLGGTRRIIDRHDFDRRFFEWFHRQDLVNGATGTWDLDWTPGLCDSLREAILGEAE